MVAETVLRKNAIDILLRELGVLNTERFISSIKNNSFDYTEWQKDLWKGKSIEEIHQKATAFEKNKNSNI
jgi:hypothetical protein